MVSKGVNLYLYFWIFKSIHPLKSVQCWCGNSYSKHGVLDDSACSSTCDGDPSQKCGASGVNSVYSVDGVIKFSLLNLSILIFIRTFS